MSEDDMDGVDGLYEISGHVAPYEAYRHLASLTFTFEEFQITFREDGHFTCAAATPDFCESTAAKIEAYVEAFALASDEAVAVDVDVLRYRPPRGTVAYASAAVVSISALAPRAVVRHADGTVSPNPSETAWLARALAQDAEVAAVARILNESRRSTRKRTRDDYIAFEMMKMACGGRPALARSTGLSLRQVRDLGNGLQVERHSERLVPRPHDFDPDQIHRQVHDLFLKWAKSRI